MHTKKINDLFEIPSESLESLNGISASLISIIGDNIPEITEEEVAGCGQECANNCSGNCNNTCEGSCTGNN